MSVSHLIKKIDIFDLDNFLSERLINEIKIKNPRILILDYLWEASEGPNKVVDQIKQFVAGLRNQVDLPILGIFNRWWEKDQSSLGRVFDDVIFVDYFLLRSYNEIVNQHRSKVSYRWNQHSSNFLFLIAKPEKANRIRLLWKLAQSGLLDSNGVWSSHLDIHQTIAFAESRALIPELSLSQFKSFVETYQKNPDAAEIKPAGKSIQYGAIPYDVNLYRNTCVSVISETMFRETDRPWITEKTWIPMLNRHPFVMAGDTNTLNLLSQKGFVTFEECLLHTDYDQTTDAEQRLDQVVENVKYFIDNSRRDLDSALEHNVNKLRNLYQMNVKDISEFLAKNKVPAGIFEVINTQGHSDLIVDADAVKQHKENSRFLDFYSAIKDSTWPDCNSEQDYDLLPDPIKKECEEIFGYVAK